MTLWSWAEWKKQKLLDADCGPISHMKTYRYNKIFFLASYSLVSLIYLILSSYVVFLANNVTFVPLVTTPFFFNLHQVGQYLGILDFRTGVSPSKMEGLISVFPLQRQCFLISSQELKLRYTEKGRGRPWTRKRIIGHEKEEHIDLHDPPWSGVMLSCYFIMDICWQFIFLYSLS